MAMSSRKPSRLRRSSLPRLFLPSSPSFAASTPPSTCRSPTASPSRRDRNRPCSPTARLPKGSAPSSTSARRTSGEPQPAPPRRQEMKSLDTAYETLLLEERAPGVVVVTLNRPDRYNAMTDIMFGELEQVALALDGE